MAHYGYSAERIVEALMNAGELEEFLGDMSRFDLMCSENHQLENTLMSPHVGRRAKATLIATLIEPFFGGSYSALMNRLNDNGDLASYQRLAEHLREEVRRRTGDCFAVISSTVPLTDRQMERIASHLERLCGHTLHIGNIIDRDLVGGFVVSVEGKRIDLSVRGDLLKVRTGIRTAK